MAAVAPEREPVKHARKGKTREIAPSHGAASEVDMLTPANEVIRTLRIYAAPNTSGRQKAKLAC
jgi:hypothetical protein